jgi:membrane-bound ClpP family serine protease
MSSKKEELPFATSNYTTMLIGIALILAGFLIMSFDSTEFGFGFLGLTLGPVVTILGFIIEFWAILRKPANS